MSHSTVLITKTQDNTVDDQLERFFEQGNEDDYFMEWIDQTEEYRLEYENGTVSEFYDASSSSWGQEISKDLFDWINSNKTGAITEYKVEKGSGFGSYFKLDKRYRGYYQPDPEKHGRCDGDAWFEVCEVVETTHPDKTTVFEGKIKIRVIDPPKKITMKEKYPDYNTYLEDYHGVEDPEKQGYLTNPDAKWDWYQIGGRWAGFFIPKKDATSGHKGDISSLMNDDSKLDFKLNNAVDVIKVKDIDWEAMEHRERERRAKYYDEEMAKPKEKRFIWDDVKPTDRDAYINAPVYHSTFAVLHDDVWYERGDMGWWGVVSDEKDRDEWDKEFRKLVDSLDPEDEVTVVDVHI